MRSPPREFSLDSAVYTYSGKPLRVIRYLAAGGLLNGQEILDGIEDN